VSSRRALQLLLFAILAPLALAGCTSIWDFDRLNPALVNDDIHVWVGQEAAAHAGAPISFNNLTEEERTLRDLAFPLIEPPFDRARWDAVVLEYGVQRYFRAQLWAYDPPAYFAHLMGEFHRSSWARYNILIDDMRNDIVRIEPFFFTARRVADLDRRRQKSMDFVGGLTPPERLSAQARVGENSLTIAWVYHSLKDRCASYKFALEHLAIAEPEPLAGDAERVLTQLTQLIAANEVVVTTPQFTPPGQPPGQPPVKALSSAGAAKIAAK
jgi:hypothetical protein